ncbi:sulfatase-like hydrolase/transferase [Lacipirellula limnantheis]|uniref:sulfatase-like hydrolase/transferase n=1 Tax=Lacipirellula limnantheis TaxID=2528024 RepID=UPI00143D32EA|nr:sulfatase-like hydrolase/transferase [Lacipirellula limnantheis]
MSLSLRALRALCFLAAAASSLVGARAQSVPPPNFLFVIVDDMSWAGSSVQMDPNIPDSKSDYYQTPRLEQLAGQGMTFSQAYGAGPMCSPSRVSIMTGKSPAQLQTTDVRQGAFVTDPQFTNFYNGYPLTPPQPRYTFPGETTIMEALKSYNSSYRGGFIGKYDWQPNGPYEGWDYFKDHCCQTATTSDPSQLVSMTNETIQFMETQVAANRPFFAYVGLEATKLPQQLQTAAFASTVQEFANLPRGTKHNDPYYAAMTKDMDTSVGQLLDRLDTLGIADNTYVIFTSDQGASWDLGNSQTNAPLYGGKGSLWEGGLRVPLFVRGPSVAAGTYSDVPVVLTDLFPTFLDLAGSNQPPAANIEGASLEPILKNGGELPVGQASLQRGFAPNGELFFHYPHYTGRYLPNGQGGYYLQPIAPGNDPRPASAVRDGDYKLVRLYGENGAPDTLLLFNVAANVTESSSASSPLNLAAQFPEKVAQLNAKLDAWLNNVDASLPFDVRDNFEMVWNAATPGNVTNGWRSVNDVDYYDREVWMPYGTMTITIPYSGVTAINGTPGASPTRVTAAPFQPGLPKNAMSFDGNDGLTQRFFQVSDSKLPNYLDGDHSATFETWVKFDSLTSQQLIFEAGSSNQGLSLTVGDADGDSMADEVRFRVLGKAGNQLTVTAPMNSFADPTQDYVQLTTVVNDGAAGRYIELYVNGALMARADGAAGFASLDWDSYFRASMGRLSAPEILYSDTLGAAGGAGPLPFSDGNLTGDVASFKFLNKALTSDEIRTRYNAVLNPVSWGLDQLTGQSAVPIYRPTNLTLGAAESSKLLVMQERNDVLQAAISVDALVTAGSQPIDPSPGELPQLAAGTAFTSYLLHYDPLGSSGAMQFVTASVTFDQNIIALLFGGQQLALTDTSLGAIGNYGLTAPRGVTWSNGDYVSIGANQRTLKFSLSTLGSDLLQFRVITDLATTPGPFIDPSPSADADFNEDGVIDAGDLLVWKSAFGMGSGADADGDGDSDGADYLAWQQSAQLGNVATSAASVPEPAAGVLIMAVGLGWLSCRRNARRTA